MRASVAPSFQRGVEGEAIWLAYSDIWINGPPQCTAGVVLVIIVGLALWGYFPCHQQRWHAPACFITMVAASSLDTHSLHHSCQFFSVSQPSHTAYSKAYITAAACIGWCYATNGLIDRELLPKTSQLLPAYADDVQLFSM